MLYCVCIKHSQYNNKVCVCVCVIYFNCIAAGDCSKTSGVLINISQYRIQNLIQFHFIQLDLIFDRFSAGILIAFLNDFWLGNSFKYTQGFSFIQNANFDFSQILMGIIKLSLHRKHKLSLTTLATQCSWGWPSSAAVIPLAGTYTNLWFYRRAGLP